MTVDWCGRGRRGRAAGAVRWRGVCGRTVGELRRESLDALHGNSTALLDPLLGGDQRIAFQAVDAALGVAAPADQAGFAQHAQVARDGGAADGEGGGAFALGEHLQDAAAGGVGEGCEEFHALVVTNRLRNM